MYIPKTLRLTPKQLEFLLFIFKNRGATARQLTLVYHPDIDFFKDTHNGNKRYFNSLRGTNIALKALRERGLVRRIGEANGERPKKVILDAAIHEVTSLGLEAINFYKEISLDDLNEKSGFDYELGYFEMITTVISNHEYFQREVYTLLTWINNRHVYLEDLKEEPLRKWNGERMLASEKKEDFNKPRPEIEAPSKYGKANICSWRNSLHASPRPNDIIPTDKNNGYHPDGEIRVESSVRHYNSNQSSFYYDKEKRTDYYYLEVDMVTERNKSLYEKFKRLVSRLKGFERVREIEVAEGLVPRADSYKGVIIVLSDSNDDYPLKINMYRYRRFMSFFNSFLKTDSSLKGKFNLVLTSPKKMENTLKSLRLEYYYDFSSRLSNILQHPDMKGYFTPKENQFGKLYAWNELGYSAYVQLDENTIYLFYGIEGFTSWRWYDFISQYTNLKEFVKKNGSRAKIYPIATFQQEMSVPLYFYKDAIDYGNDLSDIEREFYTNLHILSMFTRIPEFYYYGKAINGLPHETEKR